MPRQRHVEDDPIIFAYTRAQAIADEVLIDITDEAKACGFRIPVAITATLFHRYVAVGKNLEEYGQSTQARLQDVLTVLFFRIRSLPKGESSRELRFHVRFLMDAEQNAYEEPEIIADCGPGDHGEPVLTIMLEEDL